MSQLTIKSLLESGAHFGHQRDKWFPKMKKFIYGEKKGVHIIDLKQTQERAQEAYNFIRNITKEGKTVLFVGTKRQASDLVKETAEKCGAFFVTHKWLGGMLTNHKTIMQSIDKLRKVEKMKENGSYELLTKKEKSKIEKEVTKLERSLGGIRHMRKLPGVLVIFDCMTERTAVEEALVLGIPLVGLVDTNVDPTGIDYPVPANDDAIKSLALFTDYFAQAVIEGSGGKITISAEKDAVDVDFDRALEEEIFNKYAKDVDLVGEEV